MKANFLALGLFGLAGASAVLPRDYPTKPDNGYPSKPTKPVYHDSYPTKVPAKRPTKPAYPTDEQDFEDGYSYKNSKGSTSSWKPKSKSPEFFNIRVDEKCDVVDGVAEAPADCPFNGYAIRLEGGIFIATPYNNYFDPKLPTFFVDDDTQLYTVSKDPLQVYIDGITGALKYTKIGWLPPNAIAISFYHTGNNPLGLVDPSPSYLSWPSTQGSSFFGSPWVLCPLGSTQQYQVFINSENFGIGGPAGVAKDPGSCVSRNLAAVNANPWKQTSPAPYYPPAPAGYAGDY
ncbi:uncharacterized protein EKO05_0003646 [Ascochyta rabiei]|uniref:Uncharacterized protein n=1 Tax=Didymella rabiei TaxID=5454 RepID=A0A162YVF3_DIDRA|nr:uncharacterized protein EKO05_0003646 [Ascochyta rabiei]KZM20250.1 hypothetical protein ST47_g8621 [Ascochyta rabiei]UPX13120.1 hypothetical protein EKO05_0003646 [Ascochyta rabiei]